MKFLCRYTNSKTCSPTSYVIYERMHVCHRVCRQKFNSPKFVRMYETCMHHDKSLLHTCIVPPLICFLFSQVTLFYYNVVLMRVAPFCWNRWWHQLGVRLSQKCLVPPAPLWRVLHYAGYTEPPLYFQNDEYLEGQPWYKVQLTIDTRT